MVVKQTFRPVANLGIRLYVHVQLMTLQHWHFNWSSVLRLVERSVNGWNFVEPLYACTLVLQKKLKWSNCLPKWNVQYRMSLTSFFSLRKLSVACFKKLMVAVTFFVKNIYKENQIESGRDWTIFPQILWFDIYLVILKIYT